jgi:hypothetical protein
MAKPNNPDVTNMELKKSPIGSWSSRAIVMVREKMVV